VKTEFMSNLFEYDTVNRTLIGGATGPMSIMDRASSGDDPRSVLQVPGLARKDGPG